MDTMWVLAVFNQHFSVGGRWALELGIYGYLGSHHPPWRDHDDCGLAPVGGPFREAQVKTRGQKPGIF